MSTWYDKVHLRLDWRPEATEHGRRQTRVSHSPTAGGPSSPIGAEVGVKRERYYGHPDDDSSGALVAARVVVVCRSNPGAGNKEEGAS